MPFLQLNSLTIAYLYEARRSVKNDWKRKTHCERRAAEQLTVDLGAAAVLC